MDNQNECGCDCDRVSTKAKWNVHLTEDDLERMIEEKIARARRQREMMARIDGQLETD